MGDTHAPTGHSTETQPSEAKETRDTAEDGNIIASKINTFIMLILKNSWLPLKKSILNLKNSKKYKVIDLKNHKQLGFLCLVLNI